MSKEARCPKCKGTSGVQAQMTERHVMGSRWDEGLEAGGDSFCLSIGPAICLDCGAKFGVRALERKGFLGGQIKMIDDSRPEGYEE